MIVVYKITSPSGKVYVGSTVDWKKRLATYKKLNCKKQIKLFNSLKKYGAENHTFEILDHCDKSNVRQREHYYGHLFNVLSRNGLNHMLPKFGENLISVSEDFRIAIGLCKKGNKNNLGRKFSLEWRTNMSNAKKGMVRKPHSDLTKNKMSNAAMGGKNHKAIILLNIQTGIFYECFMDAANSIGMNYNTFRSRLYHNRSMPFIVAA
jgi:group I intron endonuclease